LVNFHFTDSDVVVFRVDEKNKFTSRSRKCTKTNKRERDVVEMNNEENEAMKKSL